MIVSHMRDDNAYNANQWADVRVVGEVHSMDETASTLLADVDFIIRGAIKRLQYSATTGPAQMRYVGAPSFVYDWAQHCSGIHAVYWVLPNRPTELPNAESLVDLANHLLAFSNEPNALRANE
ncbi:hypothetical protein HDU88_007941 [Geranomyces variabilis]|nr:hypothetical protein HDU88_007941 [Geranomyces variabilis]